MTLGIHHVAVRVTDIERSIAFYGLHTGFAAVSRATLGNGVQIAFLAHPGGGTQIELIAGLDDHLHGDGLVHHLAFHVDDVPAVFERLRDAGVDLLDDAPQSVAGGRRIFTFRGPDGERLQVTGG